MKRPLAAAGITCLAVQLLAVSAGAAVSVVLLCLAVPGIIASFILLSREHRRMILPVLISCALISGIYAVYDAAVLRPAQMIAGKTVLISGTLVSKPYFEYDRCYYLVDTDFVNTSAPQKMRIRVSGPEAADAYAGDGFSATVVISQPQDEGFSSRSGRMARGIVLTAYMEYGSEPTITKNHRGLKYRIELLRDEIIKRTDSLLSPELSGLLRGMLLGDKSGLSDSMQAEFRMCGLSHLLAVSGLHMAMIVFAASSLLRNLGVPYRPLSAVVLVVVWFYVALTGFSYSVLRAGIMTSMVLTGRIVKREADLLNSLGTALFAICLFRPYAAADVGFLLSFSSTLGLILFSSPIKYRINRLLGKRLGKYAVLLRGTVSTVVTSFIASVCTLPIIMLYFGECSIIAPLANLLCVWLSTVFMVSGAVAVILSFVPFVGLFLSHVLIALTWVCGRLLVYIARLLAGLPHASVNINFSFAPVFLIGTAVMLVLWYFLFGRGENRARSFAFCVSIIAAVFLISAVTERMMSANDRYIKLYSVGDGLAAAAVNGNSCVLVGSGGDDYELWNAAYDLQDRNLSGADAMFYTEDSKAGSAYLRKLVQINAPERIFMLPLSDSTDEAAFAVEDYAGKLCEITDSAFEAEHGRLTAEVFTDSGGFNWTYIENGKMSILFCPKGGDCAELPDDMKNPDCAVVRSAENANVQQLSAGAFIVSSDEAGCGSAEALLRYKGAENVYGTGTEDIVISEYGAGLRIGDR